METRIYKHDWRHGHHHHKNNTIYALLAMIFFGLIALGVVASIYYYLNDTKCEGQKCNPAAGSCLVGTVDCNDTPFMSKEFYKPRTTAGAYTNSEGKYQFIVPAGLSVTGASDQEISVAWPESKWLFALAFVENTNNMNLDQAFDDVFDQMRPSEYAEYTLSDMKRQNMTLSGIPAKRLDINNFGDNGSTVVVAVNNGKIYVLRGTIHQNDLPAETDIMTYLNTFKFVK
jgi:hypothetical protein